MAENIINGNSYFCIDIIRERSQHKYYFRFPNKLPIIENMFKQKYPKYDYYIPITFKNLIEAKNAADYIITKFNELKIFL